MIQTAYDEVQKERKITIQTAYDEVQKEREITIQTAYDEVQKERNLIDLWNYIIKRNIKILKNLRKQAIHKKITLIISSKS